MLTVVAVRPCRAASTAVVVTGCSSTELPLATWRSATSVGVPWSTTSAPNVSGCSISSREVERIVSSGPAR